MKVNFLLAASLVCGVLASGVTANEDEKEKKAKVEYSFSDPVQLMAGDQPVKVEAPGYACPALADMDGDGKKELLVGQFNQGKIKVFSQQEKHNFDSGQWLMTGDVPAEIPGVW